MTSELIHSPDYYSKLAATLRKQKQFEAALQHCHHALSLDPRHAEAHYQLGHVYAQLQEFSQALIHYQRVLELDPTSVKALFNLGNTLAHQRNYDLAIQHYQHALTLAPHVPALHKSLAQVFTTQYQLTQATACYHHLLTLDPVHNDQYYQQLGHLELLKGHVQQALAYHRQAIQLNPNALELHSHLLNTLNYSTTHRQINIFQAVQQFNDHHLLPFSQAILPHPNLLDPQKRLKIGYLSADLYRHVVGASFLYPILAHHDHTHFHITCYYDNTPTDQIHQQLQQFADQWLPCFDYTDDQLIAQIREDRIDLLIELMGHHPRQRLRVLAHKPAPIQISYLAYSNTTGVTAIDYRLTDAYTDPFPLADSLNSETLLRLPGSYFCYQPVDPIENPPLNSLPALHNGYLTLGSLNTYPKLNPLLFQVWSNILQQLPQAKLLIKAQALGDPTLKQEFLDTMNQLGIPTHRLILKPNSTTTFEHLSTYHEIDIALDTYPYNGATTTCEALWMGVPVITWVGEKHVSRMGLSLLTCLGLQSWAATSPEQYLQLVINLAHDLPALQHWRQSLRQRMQNSPLMDGAIFTARLEKLYRQVWKNRCLHNNAPFL